MSLKRLFLPLAGLAVVAAGAAGMTLSDTRAQPRPTPTVEQALTAAQVAQVAFAVYHMDNAGLHDLDEATAAGQIPRGALGRVRRVRIVTAATQWPQEIAPKAREFVEHALRLEAALEKEDATAAAPDAKEVHELGHDISSAAYNWLAAMSGMAGTPADSGHP
jgi:hypothetical protein